ncbi:hypothetical protein AAMO2058_000932500 [Amorphochlora amoebiformis]
MTGSSHRWAAGLAILVSTGFLVVPFAGRTRYLSRSPVFSQSKPYLPRGVRSFRGFQGGRRNYIFKVHGEEETLGKEDGAMGQGMVGVDRLWKDDQEREITEADLMRAGQLGDFSEEFESSFKYAKGTVVWYKSITHFDQWIKCEVEGFSGADLEGMRYYNLNVEMTPIPHDPCVRRENVPEDKLRSLEEGIPEGEEEYEGGAQMWINPHFKPPKARQFRPTPITIKKDVGHPKSMFWRMGSQQLEDPYKSFEYEEAEDFPLEMYKVKDEEMSSRDVTVLDTTYNTSPEKAAESVKEAQKLES